MQPAQEWFQSPVTKLLMYSFMNTNHFSQRGGLRYFEAIWAAMLNHKSDSVSITKSTTVHCVTKTKRESAMLSQN